MADAKIRVTADTAQAERQLEQLSRALNDVSKTTALATKALAGITAAGAAMGYAVMKSMQGVDELAKASRRLGMTAADLQAFRNSASLAGVSSDELTASLSRLQVNIGNALTKGTGPAKDALDRLGISMRDLQGLGADQQFQKIAEEISKIPDPAQRSAVATELLGKQGPRLLQVADEYQRMREEAEQLGIALSDTDTAAIERAGDAMSELQMIATGFINKLTAELAPIIIVIADRIKLVVMEMGGLDTIIRQRVIPAIKIATQAMAGLVAFIVSAKIVASIMAAVSAMVLMYRSIKTATIAMRTFNAAAAASPIGRVASFGKAFLEVGKRVLGVGVVLGATKLAVDAVGDGFDELDKMVDGLVLGVQKLPDPINDGAAAAAELTDQVRKAEEAYGSTLAKLRENVVYQQEILTYGQEEASIRKVIRQEQEKYAGASADVLRNFLAQENSLKSQIALQQQQIGLYNNLLTGTSNYAKEVEKLQLMQESFMFGKSMADLQKEKEQAALKGDKFLQDVLLRNQKDRVQRELMAELGKYDAIYRIDLEYSNRRRVLREIERRHDNGLNVLSRKDYEALMAAKNTLDREYEEEKLKLAKANSDRLLNLELDRIKKVLAANRSAMSQSLSLKDRETLQAIGKEERQKAMVEERINFEKRSEKEKVSWAIDQGAQMFTALGAQNKKAFEAAKAFNLANAIMNTYMAATKALATYPPPFNFIAAAAAVGMGLAQVAQIRSQQYSGRRLGGPVMGGQSYVVGEAGPEIFTPSTTGSITRNRDSFGGGAPVNVNFTINAVDSAGVDALLVQRRGLITQIINDAMVERGQRGI